MSSIKRMAMVAGVGLMCTLAGTALAAPSIVPVAAPSGFTRVTSARLSATGQFVIGTCDTGPGSPTRAFRWSPAVGSILLPVPAPSEQTVTSSAGLDISADGSAILARVTTAAGTETVIWTFGSSSTALQLPPFGINAGGQSISADGQTIVGSYAFSGQPNRPRAAKWNAAGVVTTLDAPQGLSTAFASHVSDAGEAIGGGAAPLNSPPSGALWTGGRADRLTRMGPGIFFTDSSVNGVSGDGLFLVGDLSGSDIFGTSINGMFRWSTAAAANPQLITPIPGAQTISGRSINVDGSVLGGKLVYRELVPGPMPGQFIQVDVDRAMVWNVVDGPRLLSNVLTEQSADLGDWQFQNVIDMSSDGRVLLTQATSASFTQGPFVLVWDVLTRPQCTLSDVAGANQSVGPSGDLTADDIIVFLGWYFAQDARANVAGPDQSTTPDNQLTADDIIVFLGRYFAGC
jgi:uncharacterized membrane protein